MQWFERPSQALTGIDISARHIKLLVLKKSKHPAVEIQYYAVAELPMMVLTESNDIKDYATISSTLLQLKTQQKNIATKAAIALPGSAVVTKQLVLADGQSEQQLEDQVWLEAAKHFPDLIEDLHWDFYNHGPMENDPKQVDILLVACRKTSLEKRVRVLQDSHFQVEVVDVDYYALERTLRYLLQHHYPTQLERCYALLHFSSNSSTFVVLHRQRLCYAHDQSFDCQQVLQHLQQQLTWPNIITEAHRLPTTLPVEAFPLLDTGLVGHIHHVLQLFYASYPDHPIEHVFLSGDCAVIPEIAAFLAAKTTLNISVADPLRFMGCAPGVDLSPLQATAPLFSLSAGLALHLIDHDLH